MKHFAILFATVMFASSAVARGLDDGDVVDAVMIHGVTGKPALILGVDKPVESEAIERQLDYKLGTYIGFIRSGDLYSRYSKANRDERPLIIFVFEYPPPSRVRAMAFRARDRLLEMGIEAQLKIYDESAKKNVDLAP